MIPGGSEVRFRADPRDVPPAKAARRLGLTLFDFEARLSRLQARGFPVADRDTGNYDLKAIENWMDRQSGLAKSDEAQDAGSGDFSARQGSSVGQESGGRVVKIPYTSVRGGKRFFERRGRMVEAGFRPKSLGRDDEAARREAWRL